MLQFIDLCWIYAVMLGLYEDYSSNVGNIHVQCGRYICSGAYASNVECMYASASGHIFDFSEFISGIYTDIVVSHVHMM